MLSFFCELAKHSQASCMMSYVLDTRSFCMDIPQFVQLLICLQTVCFHSISAIMNNTALNMHLQVFVGTHTFCFLGHIPKHEITKQHGNFMLNYTEDVILWSMSNL